MLKHYLAAYNLIAFILWALYIISYVTAGFQLNSFNLLVLNIAQGMAVLEIAHVVLKWIKSPVGSTVAQVFSRLLVLVFINAFVKQYAQLWVFHYGVIIVSLAWSITELVRYSFYFFTIYNRQPVTLLWMRYTFFIVLYPLGVTGEWFILATPVVSEGLSLNLYNGFMAFVLVSYIYYFPVLYKYMWKQRKAKLSTGL